MAVLVNKEAPDFEATAAVVDRFETIKLSDYRGKKYVILFFYPLDFTFVCPTELHAFQDALAEFEKRDCQVIGASIDSHYSHLAWLNTPRSQGGIQGCAYPIIADTTKKISRDYDLLIEDAGIALRGLFLIDKQGVVQHQVVNNLPLGRSVTEALRILDALRYFEQNGEVCPANWTQDSKSMKATQDGLKEYFAE